MLGDISIYNALSPKQKTLMLRCDPLGASKHCLDWTLHPSAPFEARQERGERLRVRELPPLGAGRDRPFLNMLDLSIFCEFFSIVTSQIAIAVDVFASIEVLEQAVFFYKRFEFF